MGFRRSFGALTLCFVCCLRAFAQTADAPYVLPNATGGLEAWIVERGDEGPRKSALEIANGDTIVVPAVGEVPAFPVRLRAVASPAPDVATAGRNASVFVVADTHGEYEIFASMLMRHRVVDAKLRWSHGRGHLVVLGDVFDRGPNQVEILWLLYELEAQARKAGGAVHFVLGNHELMVMGGDLRYLHPKYRETAAAMGVDSYATLFEANTVLGQWLRSKPVALKLDDVLYAHGGLSPSVVDRGYSLQQINTAIRSVMNRAPIAGAERQRAAFLLGPDGPMWYRGYFPDHQDAASTAEVQRVLDHFDVRRVIVGHTRVPTIQVMHEGRVIAVQVYPRRLESGAVEFETLRIQGGNYFRCLPEGREKNGDIPIFRDGK